MGEVYRPEDMTTIRDAEGRDLTPTSLTPVAPITRLETILREIKVIKKDIALIKQALKAHGINVS